MILRDEIIFALQAIRPVTYSLDTVSSQCSSHILAVQILGLPLYNLLSDIALFVFFLFVFSKDLIVEDLALSDRLMFGEHLYLSKESTDKVAN